jgi:AraC family transcriptional regulator
MGRVASARTPRPTAPGDSIHGDGESAAVARRCPATAAPGSCERLPAVRQNAMSNHTPSATSRAEYLARIHRVMDFIEQHLGEPLTLEQLAAVACFSPYHFHRLFTATTGEPLYQFILRLRLERAASQLRFNRARSVTAIALDNGFGSSAAFARAFRAAFGVSATTFRAEGRKKCEAIRKTRQDPPDAGGYHPLTDAAMTAADPSARRMPMSTFPGAAALPVKEAQSVRIETIEPMLVAYVRHIGPYAGDAALFGRLFGTLCQWVGTRGLFGPTTKMLTIYHDNPDVTDADKLRISVCATVPAGTKADGEVGVLTIEGGKYAVASYELDPPEFGPAWQWFMGTWMPSSGFQPDDRACFELSLNDPQQHPQKKHQVEFWEPVKPL